ncbi:hypothetical protein FTUN_0388 [Frigoriglobus tundricola]|uniref:Uncharacterized protein n=1 Tax=Frigoriglobus tundricola TaxID=2774151 RepID=A0A6M5YHS6_9BACT|nr:hypothetical protein FTUN_0388 [Frigoriglobus tundricola]
MGSVAKTEDLTTKAQRSTQRGTTTADDRAPKFKTSEYTEGTKKTA